MALTFIYREPGPVDTDITGHVVLRTGENPANMASNAEERSVGAWTLEVEDSIGEFQFYSQRTFYVLEDAADDPVIFVGQTEDKGSTRGDQQMTGAERTIGLNLIDLNTLLERRVIKPGDGGNRPAETDYERMVWLQGTGYIGGGTDWFFNDFAAPMDANDYTGRMASEVIEDCMGQSGANAYMFRDRDTGGFVTYYGDPSPNLDRRTSELRISNVETDIDTDASLGDPGAGADWVWGASRDTDWNELSTRVFAGIFANYDGGAIFEERADTVLHFSHRDTVLSWPDVKSSAKATARVLRMLDDIATEEHRITTSIEVTAAHVNDALEGERIQCRFSHFPPYAPDFVWMRILNRAVTWLAFDRYRIQYELTVSPPVAPGSCAASVAAADETADSGDVDSASGLSLAVGVMPDAPGVSIGSWVASSGTGFLSGPGPGIEAPWTLLETVAPSSVHTAMFTGYYQSATVVAPPNLPCSVVNGSGGDPGGRAIVTSFPTSSATPVQSASANGGSTVVLGGAPTEGNILHMIACGETVSLSIGSEWTVIARETLSGFTVGGGGVDIVHCIRCVDPGENAAVPSVASAFTHYAAISEWAP
jgi:hypothetical protein